ncbi:unnamed protein product [Soboliphyme baturini]|uniref:Uncharacterized protein n=1 Tax=Soboliphyme baturini TaxID=241478 RepID=A0A183IGQ4_9BILA|nr:unnamed protein product [Soboliphyme baturini]
MLSLVVVLRRSEAGQRLTSQQRKGEVCFTTPRFKSRKAEAVLLAGYSSVSSFETSVDRAVNRPMSMKKEGIQTRKRKTKGEGGCGGGSGRKGGSGVNSDCGGGGRGGCVNMSGGGGGGGGGSGAKAAAALGESWFVLDADSDFGKTAFCAEMRNGNGNAFLFENLHNDALANELAFHQRILPLSAAGLDPCHITSSNMAAAAAIRFRGLELPPPGAAAAASSSWTVAGNHQAPLPSLSSTIALTPPEQLSPSQLITSYHHNAPSMASVRSTGMTGCGTLGSTMSTVSFGGGNCGGGGGNALALFLNAVDPTTSVNVKDLQQHQHQHQHQPQHQHQNSCVTVVWRRIQLFENSSSSLTNDNQIPRPVHSIRVLPYSTSRPTVSSGDQPLPAPAYDSFRLLLFLTVRDRLPCRTEACVEELSNRRLRVRLRIDFTKFHFRQSHRFHEVDATPACRSNSPIIKRPTNGRSPPHVTSVSFLAFARVASRRSVRGIAAAVPIVILTTLL